MYINYQTSTDQIVFKGCSMNFFQQIDFNSLKETQRNTFFLLDCIYRLIYQLLKGCLLSSKQVSKELLKYLYFNPFHLRTKNIFASLFIRILSLLSVIIPHRLVLHIKPPSSSCPPAPLLYITNERPPPAGQK